MTQTNETGARAKLDDAATLRLIAKFLKANPDDADPAVNAHVQHVVNAIRAEGHSCSMGRAFRLMTELAAAAKPARKTAARKAPARKAPAKKAAA